MPELRKPPRRVAPAFARYAALVATELREAGDVPTDEAAMKAAVEAAVEAGGGAEAGETDGTAVPPVLEQAMQRVALAAARCQPAVEVRPATGGPYGRPAAEPGPRTVDRRC